ncbi:MAG: hypothetical protein K2N63_00410, partial [Lachnospiraceae bacterium]|nr:hypothetical protein [Lachnospiraceae bacterium]
ADFNRAMFYRLDGDRKKNLLENERKKYRPWQGGVFGGQLIFEIKGKQYEISRVFYDREQADEFELRDVETNLPSSDYSKKIGEEIFSVDRESFLRTVFIGQGECETSPTDDINAKLGNLTDQVNDLDSFDAANTKLTEILRTLNPSRSSGQIAKRREEIAQCERVFREGEGIEAEIALYRDRILAQEETYEDLKEQLNEAGRMQEYVSRRQSSYVEESEWRHLKETAAEKKREWEEAGMRFPGKIPEPALIKEQIAKCIELGKAYERVKLYWFSQEENEEFASLEEIFADGAPGFKELDGKIREASGLGRSKREDGRISAAELKRLRQLEPYFPDGGGNALAVAAGWAQRNQKKETLPANQEALAALYETSSDENPPAGKYSILFVAGILLMAVGIVTAWMYSMVPGIALAVLGFLSTAISIHKKVLIGLYEDTRGTPEMENLLRTIKEDTAFIERVDERTASYLASHGRQFGDGDGKEVELALQEIMMEAAEYQNLKKKAENGDADDGGKEHAQTDENIAAFLGRYMEVSPRMDYVKELYALKERVNTYATLMDKWEKLERAKESYEQIRSGIAAFYEEYGFEPDGNISAQLGDIKDAVKRYQDAEKAYDHAAFELEQFEAENSFKQEALSAEDFPRKEDGLTKEDTSIMKEIPLKESLNPEWDSMQEERESLPSLEEIHGMILNLNEELKKVWEEGTKNQSALEELQEQYGAWEENRLKLLQLKELQEVQEKKYNLVLKAREKLGMAKESMTAKYAGPMLEKFSKYYELLAGETAKYFHIDANTAVTVEEFGRQRAAGTLSRGLRDLLGIALRVAFADAMYPEEKPVLIMDDPFVNLDDRKIAAGGDFLAAVAKEYQIVYFTCSNARNF